MVPEALLSILVHCAKAGSGPISSVSSNNDLIVPSRLPAALILPALAIRPHHNRSLPTT
jgi:hypothetical protein